ncbi:MAG: PKD domain-containing protein [Bacteroidia bacterium]
MKMPFNVPAGFHERSAVKSRTISRSGFADQGVIFTTSDSPSENDFPNPSQLIGMELENTKKGESDPDRFFKILGGYFYSFVNGTHTTRKVFGICLSPADGFDMTEGGSVFIKEHWETPSHTDKGLDETLPYEGSFIQGWTFIVVPKTGDKVYPLSGDPLRIFSDCGKVTGLAVEKIETSSSEQVVKATATVSGTQPERYIWNWGDGSPETETSSPEATHTYNKPDGRAATYTIVLKTEGPGSCGSEGETSVTIEPAQLITVPCPELESLKVAVTGETNISVTVLVKASFTGGMPAEFIWEWGDGSAPETSRTAEATHSYQRTTTAKTYKIGLAANGPEKCTSGGKATVEVGAIIEEPQECPVLTGVTAAITAQDETTVTVVATAATSGPAPEKYEWNWGDGSPKETTTGPEATHHYLKPSGSSTNKTISLEISGPKDCKSSGETSVVIPPKTVVTTTCPDITGVVVRSAKALDEKTWQVELEVTYTGPKPDKFEWTWGQGGSPETTTGAKASHKFPRKANDYTASVTVKTTGPGSCSGIASKEVTISKEEVKEVSLWCKLMSYLVAFLASLALGTLLVCIVAETVEQTTDPAILIVTALTLAMFMVAVVIWMIQGKKRGCPPGKCDWLAIGWSSMLAGLGTSFFMLNCMDSWIPMAIGFLVAGGIFGFFWFRDCAAKVGANTFFVYFFLSVIATLIVMFGIAAPILNCA